MHRTVGGDLGLPAGEDNLTAVCIDNGTSDIEAVEYLCEVTAPAPKYHYEKDTAILLMRGGFEKQTDAIIETYGSETQRVMVTDDETLAVGYYLHLLEINDIGSEAEARDGVRDAIPDLFDAYDAWVADQSVSDRRLRLLDQAESDAQVSDFYRPVLESSDARWRETGLSSRNERRAKASISCADVNPKFCYKNARRIVEENWDDESVQYVEGIGLSKHAARIVGHAWVEYDGKVVEATWPWHRPDSAGTGAVYYGVEVSRETIREVMNGRDPSDDPGPLLLDADAGSMLG